MAGLDLITSQVQTEMEPTTRPTHPPKDDAFTEEELAQYDGKDESKPVYVCIKGESFYKLRFID